MKIFDLYNPSKHKAPNNCNTCSSSGTVKRVANIDDQEELIAFKNRTQSRVMVKGKWTKVSRIATIAHICKSCKTKKVVWRDVKRVNENGNYLSKLMP